MCEVTKYNFDELYKKIEETLKSAVFISVDCEFSALHVGNENKGSLFDTPSQRYQKLRNNLEQSIPLEIGLTAFSFDRDNILYIAKPFKFYVFPANFGILDKVFACQSSGFHFLGEHKFDFNKVIYSGIPFINIEQEQEILQHINNGKLYEYCKYSMDNIGRQFLRNHETLISEWFFSNLKEQEKVVCDISAINICLIYILHKDTRTRFSKQLWTYEENQQFKVKRVSPETYNQLNSEIPLDNNILSYTLGFTKIYRLLTSLKKPVVGHNFLNDLVLLINTFERPIPQSYKSFKDLANKRFPSVYDTKTISFELLKFVSDEKKWKSNGLQELYEYFKNETGRHLVPRSPRIELADEFKTYTDDKFHDAGWDAYCTGYCFIRMAHFFAAKDHALHNRKVFMSGEHLRALDCFKNHVNLIRATTPYLNLSGADPASMRPPCLIIQSTNHKPVDIFKVTELLREYGSVDIKPHSCKGRRAIVAVANYGRGGAIASGSVLAWLLHSQIMKSS